MAPTGNGRDDSRGRPERRDELPKGKPGWGRVARKGADAANRDDNRDHPQPNEALRATPQDKWRRVDKASSQTKARNRSSGSKRVKIEASSLTSVPQAQRDRTAARLGDAARAFSDERFEDSRKILTPLAERYPEQPEVRELLGLTYYRLGRWKESISHLDALYGLTGSTEQHPVLADAHRATGDHERVRELWDVVRNDHPDPSVITEGRIVMAGSLADQGDLSGAIRLLEQGPVKSKSPQDYHLRLWYALADLYERAGDSQRANRGFRRIAGVDSSFADVGSRLS